mmetsp:Transcript_3018/g.6560  ORF Transcript_3018/g.6560 Transcript_3018/m.6560 type:complete len:80 (-) Transcript_3018:58-297(-)
MASKTTIGISDKRLLALATRFNKEEIASSSKPSCLSPDMINLSTGLRIWGFEQRDFLGTDHVHGMRSFALKRLKFEKGS